MRLSTDFVGEGHTFYLKLPMGLGYHIAVNGRNAPTSTTIGNTEYVICHDHLGLFI